MFAGRRAAVLLAAMLAMTACSGNADPQPDNSTDNSANPAEASNERDGVATARIEKVVPEAREEVDYQLLDARLQQLMERPSMVGLAVGVVENGRITFLRGYGETAADSDEEVTPETVFRWASVSKGVAATMVAKLAEQGELSLAAPVARYSDSLKLPKSAENRASVGDLLSHRLGIYRHAYDNKLEEGQDPRFLRQTLSELNLICQPGTCWSYQNVAYDAAAEIVARVTGRSFPAATQQMLFNPLGMNSASMSKEGIMTAASWARPHNGGRRELQIDGEYYKVAAAGGVNSNIKDMAVWMLAQMGRMPDVVSPAVLEEIHAPLVETSRELSRLRKFRERLNEAWYGYGWRSYDYAGHRIVGHRGGVDGYRSLILFDPEKKSGVVALWNSNTNQPGGLEFEVMDMIYGLPFRDWLGVDAPRAAPAREDEEEAVSQGGGSPGASGARR